jgi:hypothetical protein
MEIQCKILDSKQSDKFLFMQVEFTKSYFFGLWNQNEVHWVYFKLLSTGDPIGYAHFVDENEYIFVKYGSAMDSFLSKKAQLLTKEHQKFKEHLETQFMKAI